MPKEKDTAVREERERNTAPPALVKFSCLLAADPDRRAYPYLSKKNFSLFPPSKQHSRVCVSMCASVFHCVWCVNIKDSLKPRNRFCKIWRCWINNNKLFSAALMGYIWGRNRNNKPVETQQKFFWKRTRSDEDEDGSPGRIQDRRDRKHCTLFDGVSPANGTLWALCFASRIVKKKKRERISAVFCCFYIPARTEFITLEEENGSLSRVTNVFPDG